MAVTKKPDLSDPVLRAKLAKGMGHNYYGEPAWPNDLLYIFPVVIFGTFACVIGLSVLDPAAIGEPANPFATPLEILPEWYFYPVFQILRVVPNKLLGVLLMAAVPAGLLTVPFIENINKFQKWEELEIGIQQWNCSLEKGLCSEGGRRARVPWKRALERVRIPWRALCVWWEGALTSQVVWECSLKGVVGIIQS